jgi:hypothetical protein
VYKYLEKLFSPPTNRQHVEVVPSQLYISSEQKGEVLLSDGRFATIFKVKAGHLAMSLDHNKMHEILKIMTMTVKIDDKPITIEEAFNLDIHDFNKISHFLFK